MQKHVWQLLGGERYNVVLRFSAVWHTAESQLGGVSVTKNLWLQLRCVRFTAESTFHGVRYALELLNIFLISPRLLKNLNCCRVPLMGPGKAIWCKKKPPCKNLMRPPLLKHFVEIISSEKLFIVLLLICNQNKIPKFNIHKVTYLFQEEKNLFLLLTFWLFCKTHLWYRKGA